MDSFEVFERVSTRFVEKILLVYPIPQRAVIGEQMDGFDKRLVDFHGEVLRGVSQRPARPSGDQIFVTLFRLLLTLQISDVVEHLQSDAEPVAELIQNRQRPALI